MLKYKTALNRLSRAGGNRVSPRIESAATRIEPLELDSTAGWNQP